MRNLFVGKKCPKKWPKILLNGYFWKAFDPVNSKTKPKKIKYANSLKKLLWKKKGCVDNFYNLHNHRLSKKLENVKIPGLEVSLNVD